MKILVMGASGFLGTKLFNMLSKEHDVIGTYSNDKQEKLHYLDASNFEKVKFFLMKHKPEVIIDTIALTSSVICEKNPSICKKLNYETAKNILQASKFIDSTMVFISSSYIFDGEKGNYNETSRPNPLNEYGKTKFIAEEEIMKYKNSIILRVDIMYGYNGKNKPNGIFDKVLRGKEIELGNPYQIRSPLLVDDLPGIIIKLIQKEQTGIFNIASLERIKTIDFIKKLENLIRKDSKIIVLNEKELLVKSMKDSSLDISKIKSIGIKTTSLEEGLEILKKLIDN